jgi:hypothetical protein
VQTEKILRERKGRAKSSAFLFAGEQKEAEHSPATAGRQEWLYHENPCLGVGVDGPGDVDGVGAGVGIDDDFDAVFGAQEFDDVASGGA